MPSQRLPASPSRILTGVPREYHARFASQSAFRALTPTHSEQETCLRAAALHFTDAPDIDTGAGVSYLEDAVLVMSDGRIRSCMPAGAFAARGGDLERCEHLPGALMMPGFIDAHVHAPQLNVMASYGEQLLDWLQNYTFPEECRFADPTYAARESARFLDALLAHGTTSALVFATVHEVAAEALFEAAEARNLRLIAGKVLTDRNVPAGLDESLDDGMAASARLIERWHGRGRLSYALTPRFAITSTADQLARVGELMGARPDLYLQTHLSENPQEIEETLELFPQAEDYVDVYDRHGLCGPRSVFAHGIHLSEREVNRLAECGSRIAFCPTSNLFLGSGLLDLRRLERHGVPLALATDVGGGTSLSLLRTMGEGYKVLQLQGHSWHPLEAFYLATLGNARALQIDHHVGSLEPGKEADVVILEPGRLPLLAERLASCRTITERLFALMTLGDERLVARSYVAGRALYHAPTPAGEGRTLEEAPHDRTS